MASELSKNYDPAAVQAEVAAIWEAEKAFHVDPTDPGEPYSIVIPPPNVTAALHLGHALNNTIQDILTRKARMEGKNAVWLPGTDHAGIATQTVVEKRVMAETGKRRTEFSREEFVGKIQAWKDEYEQIILGQLKAMGCSCDWDRTAFTMDEPRARAVREAFFQLFKAGLIYRGKRLVNWDPVTQTALADDEVEMEEVDGFFYYLKYPVVSSTGASPVSADHGRDAHATEYVVVATTRPETMLGDTAVAINPSDPRAAALKGMFVKLPIVGRLIPIIEDEYVVKPIQFGGDPADVKAQMATGFLKVTPAHDPNDYDIGQRHKLPVINVMAPDGSVSDKHGWTDVGEAEFLLGLSREAAREAVVEWFRRHGLLEDVKPYRHSVGHSYRSHVPIEPYLSDQWYCRVTDDRLRGAALRAMVPGQKGQPSVGATHASPAESQAALPGEACLAPTQNKLTFYPARYAKTYQTWHENIRDWCISRQLWWGHRIPVWSGKQASLYQSDLDPYEGTRAILLTTYGDDGDDLEVPFIAYKDADGDWGYQYCVPSANSNRFLNELKSAGYKQDPDVLDTWFSSALWPMSTLGWPVAGESTTPDGGVALSKWNPTTVLTTAREIITLWVSRMVMFNEFFLGQIPFKDVFIHAMIQDGQGRKMSKSLGNGVDPLDIISSHGTDAMRYTLASMCTQTQDVRMPVERDSATGKNTSPKFDVGRNFANKVWNAARFVLMQIGDSTSRQVVEETPSAHQTAKVLTLADLWILSRLNRTIAEVDAALADYRFDQYAKCCYDFFWGDFCDWYLEAVKPQMKDATRRASTGRVLASVLDASLRLMHPMIPFITEKLWWQLNETYPDRGVLGRIACPTAPRIIKAQWPRRGEVAESAEAIFAGIQEIVGAIRNLRSDYKVDAKKSVNVSLRASEEKTHQILSLKASIETLASCVMVAVGSEIAEPANSAKAQAGGCELFVEGLIDEQAEQQRRTKRCEELTKAIAAMKGRLTNQGYLAKAPPHLVKQTQDQLAEAEAEAKELGCGT